MKKNLSALCFAGLVALTGLVATGCGSDDATFVNGGNGASIHEYAVIANSGNNSVTVKGVNLQNGTSSILNNSFTTGVGSFPTVVKTHPNINVVYVLNQSSATVSQFTMNASGGLDFKGTVATPANPALMVIHPSGGLVYVVGSAATTNSVGIIQRYTVNGSGLLTAAGATQNTTANFQGTSFIAKDADFSFGGGTFHVPCNGAIESYSVAADGTLSGLVSAAMPNANDKVRDIDVRPGQASLVSSVFTNSGTDKLYSFAVNNGVLSNRLETNPGATNLGMGDFSSNGQYYVANQNANQMFGYNVDNTTGTLTALATNPMAVGTGTTNLWVNLDPSNNFILSTSATAENLLIARFRGQNGEFVGSTVDSQGLSTPQGFDFFNFNF